MNRLAGLPPGTYAPARRGAEDGAVDVGQRFHGIVPVAYEESPFEWVEGEGWRVEREFESGPAKRLRVAVDLAPEGEGTRLTTRLVVTPRSRWTSWLVPVLMRGARRGLDKAYEVARAEVSGNAPPPRPRGAVRARALERLARPGGAIPPAIAERLADHIATADASELRRIRPFALADRWGVTRREALAAALHAVRAGALELHWDSLCPHCRGAKRTASTLSEVRPTAACDACGCDFEVEFDRGLEAAFRPAADLRRIGPEVWCVGGPGNAPHVVLQSRVPAGGETEVVARLKPGAYRVRGGKDARSAPLRVDAADEEAGVVEVWLADDGPRVLTPLVAGAPLRLRLKNPGARNAVARVERTAWLDDVATALDVVLVPGFRDLFASEVLAPGERIAVRRVAILFTDLRGSTALYRRIGDAAAYARVREHFRVLAEATTRHGGAVVKTIGDAVMAAFRSAADAVAAAADMHAGVARLAPPAEGFPLVLKTGLHCGPSIAVNAGGRIDYFGTTTNLAARAEHESRGGDLVATDEVFDDEEVRRALASIAHRAETFRAPLKGFDDEVALHRISFGA
jgi:class 3 adenylate cyclase